jgi:hypothetical protein
MTGFTTALRQFEMHPLGNGNFENWESVCKLQNPRNVKKIIQKAEKQPS